MEVGVTDPTIERGRGCDCAAGLECIFNIIRALRMGSCLSAEGRSPGSPSTTLGIRKRKNSRKRFGSRSSSFESKKGDQLHKIPGRLFFNGSTEIASLFTQQGKKGTNQDAMIVWEVSLYLISCVFLSVFLMPMLLEWGRFDLKYWMDFKILTDFEFSCLGLTCSSIMVIIIIMTVKIIIIWSQIVPFWSLDRLSIPELFECAFT